MSGHPGECAGGLAGSYQPSVLVVDVAMVLAQRGVEATVRGGDLPQAHQAAWTLLDLLGVRPDTSGCPCLACGGAVLHLARLDIVAADDPLLTGHPHPDDASERGASPVDPPRGDGGEGAPG